MSNIIKFPSKEKTRLELALIAINENKKPIEEQLLDEIERLHSFIETLSNTLTSLSLAILADKQNSNIHSAMALRIGLAAFNQYVSSSLHLNEIFRDK